MIFEYPQTTRILRWGVWLRQQLLPSLSSPPRLQFLQCQAVVVAIPSQELVKMGEMVKQQDWAANSRLHSAVMREADFLNFYPISGEVWSLVKY